LPLVRRCRDGSLRAFLIAMSRQNPYTKRLAVKMLGVRHQFFKILKAPTAEGVQPGLVPVFIPEFFLSFLRRHRAARATHPLYTRQKKVTKHYGQHQANPKIFTPSPPKFNMHL
jgi:hypothetical protein